MDYIDQSLQKKINSMPKDSEIMPLSNLDAKMSQLVYCLDRMASKKNNDIERLNNCKELRKNKEDAIKQIKEEIKELETRQNITMIELERDNKTLRLQNLHKRENTKANIDNDSVQSDIGKICDEIQQLVGEIHAYGDYTIAITPEIEEKKQSIDSFKRENNDLTREIKCLLDKEKKSILEVKRIIDQINVQEVESQRFLESIEQKVNTEVPKMNFMSNISNNNNEDGDEIANADANSVDDNDESND